MPVILGIDPGSRITGFGVIEAARTPRYIASGCIRVREGSLDERLRQIFDGISEVVREYRPEEAAIEQIFMARNPDSALKLGQARGVAIVACASAGVPVAEYAARQVKQAVVGKGSADKSQVQHMVTAMLKLSAAPQADAADALAVALCHLHTSQSLLHVQGATRSARGRLR